MNLKKNHMGKKAVIIVSSMAAVFFVAAEGGFLAYLLSLREVIQRGSVATVICLILSFCSIFILFLVAKHRLESQVVQHFTNKGLDAFVDNVATGVISPAGMSQLFLSSISANLPSDTQKSILSRIIAVGSLTSVVFYGLFLLYLEPVVFLVSSSIAYIMTIIKSKIAVDIVFLSNKRLLYLVNIYRNIKADYSDGCKVYFRTQYKGDATEVHRTDSKLGKKYFLIRLLQQHAGL